MNRIFTVLARSVLWIVSIPVLSVAGALALLVVCVLGVREGAARARRFRGSFPAILKGFSARSWRDSTP
ncbi:hypothetical protein [Agromyces archimandritae]|uniref:Uncharacterized protein n=1 Tax=Agromyces archimandritae TaxID=2781962 RepID=A0A975IML9_9MICO|nr:hypothetical protein [Agromyces archimandritae]QTX03304.1 hypothetical protein G127AT_07855 [Agromyces archimandritae]